MTSIHDLMKKLAAEQDRKLEAFFLPYVRVYCAAYPLTADALAEAGLAMATTQGGDSVTYQLMKDGKAVSPAYIIDFTALTPKTN